MTSTLFYIFSTVTILSSFFVVFSSNPVHSVLFLIFSFFNVAIIFLLSDAEFLAMTLVIVYVGAVAVLFLFVVMININEVLVKEGFLKYFPLGLLLISVFLTELIVVFKDLEFFSNNNTGISISNLLNQGHENTKSLGLFLYTDFFIIFQISGYLLLVAMIGAIVLAHDNKLSLKSQNVLKQKQVKKDDIIKLK